ncbi:MAG TPA: NADH oxidase [Balneolaceae bacterium]|nr:NADH oxidase [Balneola sp.]HBQ58981.1 NADH oxidase [Balneolaceae bacterium]|tara:strand:+ start:74668 stop:74988 length:321 start_codon:yes stop_codon:yes gene_type:complete
MEFITVQELKERKENGDSFFLLDVRDYHEYLVSNLDGYHIPYHELEDRLDEIKDYRSTELIVMCRSGNTSQDACRTLLNAGFQNVISLQGGMKRWAKEIDTSLPVI